MLGFQSLPAGLLGAAAIAGTVLAHGAYRRWKGKGLDVCSELRKERESLRVALAALPQQLEFAKRSRAAAAEAAGSLRSDAMQQWQSELEVDLSEVQLLASQLPAPDIEYRNLSDLELDIRLVEILALSLRADCLADKYGVSRPLEPDAVMTQVTAERAVDERLVAAEFCQGELGLGGTTGGAGEPAPHAAFSLAAER
jgi:hypothetical protein